MPHSNSCWVDSASSVRCAKSARSSLSNSFCNRIVSRVLSSPSEGGVGGLPRQPPSAQLKLEPAKRESGPKGLRFQVDFLEDDGVDDDWRVNDENCLSSAKDWSK